MEMGKYKNMSFPWISKSKLKLDDYCKFEYYDRHVLKNIPPKKLDAVEGSNIHMVFAKFFGDLKREEVEPYFNLPQQDIQYHPFRKFIYERCMYYVHPEQRGNPVYKNLIRNFATAETERWVELNDILDNKDEIFKYFRPILIEKRLEEETIFIYGTIDRADIGIFPPKIKKIIITDYKSGNVPRDILDGPDPMKQFSWKLPSRLMKEMHFYVIEYLLKSGWKMHDELIEFLIDEKWWFTHKSNLSYQQSKKIKTQYLSSLNTKKNNRFKLYKGSKVLEKGDVIICVYFLGGKKPYKAMKEFNYRSYKAVLMHINDLRSREFNQMYVTHPKFVFDEKVCSEYKRCSNVEKCRAMIENDKKNE